MQPSTGVTNGVMRYKISEPGAHRIGIALSSGVFTLKSSDGTDLTNNNAGFITLKSVTPGILKEYFLTANQSFNDATSGAGSDITGALFGYPTGVDVTDDVIFTGYAVVNDAETALAIMIGVDDTLTSAPANTLIGTPSNPTAASTSGSLFSFTDVTTTDYENNPLVPIFRMRMRMDVNDDWTVQTLDNADGMIPPGEWLPITIETDSGTATMYQRKFSFLGSGDASTSASGNGVIVDSTPVGSGGAWELISSATASASATIDFTGLSSTYFMYMVVANGVIPDTDSASLTLRTSTDGGSSYDSGASDYGHAHLTARFLTTQSISQGGDNSDSRIIIAGSQGNASNEISNFVMYLQNPSALQYFYANWTGASTLPTAERFTVTGSGARLSATDVDAIRFSMSSGNIDSGEFKLYGLKAA